MVGSVVVYGKRGCKFCDMSKELLEREGIPFTLRDITDNPSERSRVLSLVSEFNHKTYPFIFLSDTTFVGGYTELCALIDNGILTLGDDDVDF